MNEPFLLSNLIELQELDNEIFKLISEKSKGTTVKELKTHEIEFKKLVEHKLNTSSIRTNEFFNNLKEINKIAILPGSGTQFIDEILEEVDVFITGDISHRYLLKADDANMGLLQVGHITTEIPGMKKFVKNLNKVLNQELEYLYKDFYE